MGFSEAKKRNITAMHVVYQKVAGHKLVRSAVYTRLTPKLARLLKELALAGIDKLSEVSRKESQHLKGFKDLLALDATVLRLHDWLRKTYSASRTNHTKAADKLHMVMSVLTFSPKKVRLTSERVHDTTPWKRVGKWVKGCLLLFDLGYYSFSLFDRIDTNGGFFLSRAKSNANPEIVQDNMVARGRAKELVGRKLQDVLPDLKRKYFDVMVKVTLVLLPMKERSTYIPCERSTEVA
jgi:putative transposase